MDATYGYGTETRTTFDIYGSIIGAEYALNPPRLPSPCPVYPNKMVDHVLSSIEKQKVESPAYDTIDEIFKDRLTLIRSKIELILIQLGQRKEIHHEIMYRIELDNCQAQNLLNERLTRTFAIDRDRVNLERIKFDLEQQKRREQAGYFNDTARLNMELRDTLIQYLRGRGAFWSQRWFTDDPPDQRPMIDDPRQVTEDMLAPGAPFMRQVMAQAEQEDTQARDDPRRQLEVADVPKPGGKWRRSLGESLLEMGPNVAVLMLVFGLSVVVTVVRFERYDLAA